VATNPTAEGEANGDLYVEAAEAAGSRVTRLRGIPVGADLEYAER